MIPANREAWLIKAVDQLKPMFKQVGFGLPPVRVSVGLPAGRGIKNVIAQCWARRASRDRVNQIFVSPAKDDSREVLAALVHELAHAHLDNKGGHGPKFKRVAEAVGLTGPMRATIPTPPLLGVIDDVIRKLGPIPHARLDTEASPIKKQTTRLIKMECEKCGYIVRASRVPILTWGPVLCPCSRERMKIHAPSEA